MVWHTITKNVQSFHLHGFYPKTTRMNYKIFRIIFIALFSTLLIQCNKSNISNTVKLHPNDPYKNSIVQSQTFDIKANQDNVIEGKNGTIIVCPKACFINSKGEIVEDNVKIELAEALSLEDMLLSNLTTSSDGNPLETDGMIYFNATSKGEQLSINEDNPIHIDIPTSNKKAGMMAYHGMRDEKGNMNWIEPKELDNFLVTIDLNNLDFLPEGFQLEVEKGMPYKSYESATQGLTDSLYYQLSLTDGSFLTNNFVETNSNEPYENRSEDGENKSNPTDSFHESSNDKKEKPNESPKTKSNCGIDPAIIKVIKSDKYQNTFIATREFEARLKVIFKTCNNSVLETYIRNLDKNLYEVDKLAADLLGENQYSQTFINFSEQRLTKVKEANKYAQILKGFYEKQLAKVKSDLLNEKEKLIKELRKKNEAAKEVVDEYKKHLFKREKYRMETYGFTWNKTGWINIDIGIEVKSWGPKSTEGIFVKNGKEFDRVYSYIIFSSLKSLYRLNSTDNVEFYVGNEQEKQMLMPKNGKAILISIGYKGEVPAIAIQEFELSQMLKANLILEATNMDKVREVIRKYESLNNENDINKDLEFMLKLFKENKRQKELKKESEFLNRLWNIAFPCCKDNLNGEKLFFRNCSSCHEPNNNLVVGPGLEYSTKNHSKIWLYKWTTNAESFIRSGDKEAIKVFNEYNQSVQPKFDLSQQEVLAIYDYIDNYNRRAK